MGRIKGAFLQSHGAPEDLRARVQHRPVLAAAVGGWCRGRGHWRIRGNVLLCRTRCLRRGPERVLGKPGGRDAPRQLGGRQRAVRLPYSVAANRGRARKAARATPRSVAVDRGGGVVALAQAMQELRDSLPRASFVIRLTPEVRVAAQQCRGPGSPCPFTG